MNGVNTSAVKEGRYIYQVTAMLVINSVVWEKREATVKLDKNVSFRGQNYKLE